MNKSAELTKPFIIKSYMTNIFSPGPGIKLRSASSTSKKKPPNTGSF
jgi:hypothetical protein